MRRLEDRDYFTTSEAAEVLGVRQETVRAWARAGRLRVFRVGPKLYRLPKQAVLDAAAGRPQDST